MGNPEYELGNFHPGGAGGSGGIDQRYAKQGYRRGVGESMPPLELQELGSGLRFFRYAGVHEIECKTA